MKALVLVILFAGAMAFAADKQEAAPDLILYNGSVYVGSTDPAPASVRRVQALAIRDGRVTSIGTSSDVRKLAGPKTKQVDLHGQFVMPGFNDAHIHLWSGGLEMQHVDLTTAISLEDM